jgi:signal transduction histidine kinase
MQQKTRSYIKKGYTHLFIVLVSLMLIFGLYQVYRVVQSGKEGYTEIKQIALTAAALMHYDDLAKLNAMPQDTLKKEYGIIKEHLSKITKVNMTAVFAYLYTIRDGKVLFIADSEPSNSPDCSPAGQELTEATALDKTLMNEGSQPVIEYSKDRWGDWVSILIPLNHPETHRNVAVFGMDFDAKAWKAKRAQNLFLAILVVFLSLLAILIIFRLMASSEKLKRDNDLLRKTEADLLKAKEKAEESDRLKTSFLKNISHEIRTPMNSILGFAGLLKEQDVTLEYKELYVQNMINSGQRMLNTIYDIIDLSRVQSGQISATATRSNMAEELYRIQEVFSSVAKDKNLEFRCSITEKEKELFFYADHELLHNILQKLLWNAFKFTSKGFVEVGYALQDKMLEFFVSDSGVGVDEAQKTFIFEQFRQGNESLTRNYEGNGLGLTIAKAYVELLGGTISVESELGNGTVFRFSLPFYPHEPQINR